MLRIDSNILWTIINLLILYALMKHFLFQPVHDILGKRKQIPEKIRYLGRILPAAIMAVLIVYCLKEVPAEFLSGGYKKLIAAAVCVALHVWKKNTFVSIIGSTIVYMLL